jgi:hypothetical protein
VLTEKEKIYNYLGRGLLVLFLALLMHAFFTVEKVSKPKRAITEANSIDFQKAIGASRPAPSFSKKITNLPSFIAIDSGINLLSRRSGILTTIFIGKQRSLVSFTAPQGFYLHFFPSDSEPPSLT